MVTFFLVLIGVVVLSMKIAKDKVDGFFIGVILGFIFGIALALVIGANFPIKATVMASQPIEQVIVDSGNEGSIFLLIDEKEDEYTYNINGNDTVVRFAEADIKFEAGVTPYVEYVNIEHDFPEGQDWWVLFGISQYPSDSIVIHIPQGVVYLK